MGDNDERGVEKKGGMYKGMGIKKSYKKRPLK